MTLLCALLWGCMPVHDVPLGSDEPAQVVPDAGLEGELLDAAAVPAQMRDAAPDTDAASSELESDAGTRDAASADGGQVDGSPRDAGKTRTDSGSGDGDDHRDGGKLDLDDLPHLP